MSFCCSIAFYNLENLFDPEDGEHTLDRNYTPGGLYAWDQRRYMKKIENLGRAISAIGTEESAGPPLIVGVCEVENSRCLDDLVRCESLREYDYDYVHHESEDRRGLDTGLLYRKSHFEVLRSTSHNAEVIGPSGKEKTRDILHVEGKLGSERLHILVNHWPSRNGSSRSTRNKRRTMALEMNRIVDSIYHRESTSKIVITGDFNDGPGDRSLKRDFSHDFTNIHPVINKDAGTALYRKKWVLFDQILLNRNLLNSHSLIFRDAGIFNPPFLVNNQGRHKGGPKRTFEGLYHRGGFSDHFPVYAIFESRHGNVPLMRTLSMS
jgi:hypothetical protein